MKQAPFVLILFVISLLCTHFFLSETHVDLSLFGSGPAASVLEESPFIFDLGHPFKKPLAAILSLFTYWSWTHLVFTFIFMLPLTYIYEKQRSFLTTLLFFTISHLSGLFLGFLVFPFTALSPYFTGPLFIFSALGGERMSYGVKRFKFWALAYTVGLLILSVVSFSSTLQYFLISLPHFLGAYFLFSFKNKTS